MGEFSSLSYARLSTCDPRLKVLFESVVETFDCSVICGFRGELEQNEAYRSGKSEKRWPNSKHNRFPSIAVDVAPYASEVGIDWEDREWATYFAGFVMGVAKERGYKLRWGGDWDGDWQVRDNKFDDLWHFELIT